jgi:dihydroneopterin aldolase
MNNDGASIFIRELDLSVVIGVSPGERKSPQTVRIDLEIAFHFLSDRHPTRTDRVTDTLDYESLISRIIEVSQRHSPALLERFGELIAETLFGHFEQIESLRISLHKIPAPLAEGLLGAVGITLYYSKKGMAR